MINKKLENLLEREKKIDETLKFIDFDNKDKINRALIEKNVINKLRMVIDPELGINIFDLGLIYDFEVKDNLVYIEMTLTTVGCPLGNVIEESIINNLKQDDFSEVKIKLTFDPPWTPDSLPYETKLKLNFL